MPDYCVYILDSSGHFSDAVPLELADDNEAMKQAKQLVDGHDIELWQRDRKIARYDRKASAMTEGSGRIELERRLEQARRMMKGAIDPLTIERIMRLIRELEEQLR